MELLDNKEGLGMESLLALIKLQKTKSAPIQAENLRYVVYLRKSTDESSQKQIKSLGDQKSECLAYAERRGLKVVEVIEEAESAKTPEIRPKFRKMLDGVYNAKYDGILTWAPDRLSRNMKEAGEIIDMLDKRILVDLKFVTIEFSNDSMGKMLLGMSFVLSKQYSDNLSDNVQRGNRKRLEEGKFIGKQKQGYIKDRNQYLRPDPEPFKLLKTAWLLRAEGQSLDHIVQFLNDKRFSLKKKVDSTPEIYKWTKQKLSIVFKDPFYAGLLVIGEQHSNLAEHYDFEPMISLDLYYKVNGIKVGEISAVRAVATQSKRRANLLRGMILCEGCDKPLNAGITSKKSGAEKKEYFYFKHTGLACRHQNKSIRAKKIIEYAEEYLMQRDFGTPEAYEAYAKDQGAHLKMIEQDHKRKTVALQNQLLALDKKIKEIKEFFPTEKDEEIKSFYRSDLKWSLEAHKNLSKELAELKGKTLSIKSMLVAYPKFLELSRNLAKTPRKLKTMEDLDRFMRNVFSNFTVDGGKVVSASLKSPFKELAEHAQNANNPKWSGLQDSTRTLINMSVSGFDLEELNAYLLRLASPSFLTPKRKELIYLGISL